MKKILFSLIVIALFSMCNKESSFELSDAEKIQKLLPPDYQKVAKSILQSFEYGFVSSNNMIEQVQSSVGYFVKDKSINNYQVNSFLSNYNLKSAGTLTFKDIIDKKYSKDGKSYISELFNVFKDIKKYHKKNIKEDTFLFADFKATACNQIYQIEKNIVNSKILSAYEKSRLILAAETLSYFITELENTSLFVLNNVVELKSANGFFSSLWDAVEKVVSGIITVVIQVIIVPIESFFTAEDPGGLIARIGCGVVGIFYGLYDGIYNAITCDPWDWECMAESQEVPCVEEFEF